MAWIWEFQNPKDPIFSKFLKALLNKPLQLVLTNSTLIFSQIRLQIELLGINHWTKLLIQPIHQDWKKITQLKNYIELKNRDSYRRFNKTDMLLVESSFQAISTSVKFHWKVKFKRISIMGIKGQKFSFNAFIITIYWELFVICKKGLAN